MTSTSPSSPCRPPRSRRSSPTGGGQGRARPRRGVRGVRRDRRGGTRPATATGTRGAWCRHAGGRPELLRVARHRPRGVAERLALTGHAAARPAGLLLRSPARSGSRCSTTPRNAVSASRRSCRRATGSTSAATTSCSSGRTTRRPTPCMLYLETHRQPAQVQPGRPAAVPPQAGGRREVRPGRAATRRTVTWCASRRAPAAAVDALFRGAGVIRVDTIHEMFDVGALVAHQPLPAGRRVAIVGNSDALAVLAADACEEAGLEVVDAAAPARRRRRRRPTFAAALDEVFADDDVDSVVALFIPPLATPRRRRWPAPSPRRRRVVDQDGGLDVPRHARRAGRAAGTSAASPERSVPSYPTPEDAVRALAAVTDYAAWRADPGRARGVSRPGSTYARRATWSPAALAGGTSSADASSSTRTELQRAARLLRHRPLADARRRRRSTRRVAAAGRLGYPVALKTTAPHLRHRGDLGGVRLDIDDEPELRGAYAAHGRSRLGRRLGRALRRAADGADRRRLRAAHASRTRCSGRSCPSGSAASRPSCSATGRTASRR